MAGGVWRVMIICPHEPFRWGSVLSRSSNLASGTAEGMARRSLLTSHPAALCQAVEEPGCPAPDPLSARKFEWWQKRPFQRYSERTRPICHLPFSVGWKPCGKRSLNAGSSVISQPGA